MTVGIAGARSTITQEFCSIVGDRDKIVSRRLSEMPLYLDRYLVCVGYLAGERITEISEEQSLLTWRVNFVEPVQFCERVFAVNQKARICLMGSESGFSGSYDWAYAGAKAALHSYVQAKKLVEPKQMITAIAPHIILDSGMTQRRSDLAELEVRARSNRTQKWLSANEVAQQADYLLYRASVSTSGQVVRMRP